jgi:hypothetical protein
MRDEKNRTYACLKQDTTTSRNKGSLLCVEYLIFVQKPHLHRVIPH